VGGQRHAPAALPQERDPVPIVLDAKRSSGSFWMCPENLASTGVRTLDRPAPSKFMRTEITQNISYEPQRYVNSMCYKGT
jgi:hypothetical protein